MEKNKFFDIKQRLLFLKFLLNAPSMMCEKKVIKSKRSTSLLIYVLFFFFTILTDVNKLLLTADIQVLYFLVFISLEMSVTNNRTVAVSLNQLVASIPVRRKLVDQNDRDKFEWSQVCVYSSWKIICVYSLFI
jgi:hypothetical protein